MPSVRVNVAVLSISDSAARGNVAIENIVADRLTEAGHSVAAFEAVRDSETAIRSQLVGWLADPDVDVVVVIGDGEQTSVALKPMVDQALPGFADLLRMLAFQEIGASAMLSAAEAARCGTTFVFVLPGNENAVKAAMDKLILPQLDPKTKPRNLIGSMPRLRDAVEHDVTRVDVAKLGEVGPADVTRVDNAKMESARVASAKPETTSNSVPTPIPVEKTASGAGLQPKLPAGRAEPVVQGPRPKSRTGVNVVARKDYDPTKPIELDKLEKQIALSKEEEATKAAPAEPATSPAPTTPPATIVPAARANISTRPLDVGNLRAPATPNANAKPLPSITARAKPPVDDHTKVDHHTNPEQLAVGDATKPLPITATAAETPRPQRPSRPKVSEVGDATKPLDLNRLPKLPPGANQDDVEIQPTDEIIALSQKTTTPAPTPTPTPVARVQLKSVTPPPTRVRQPTPPIPTSVVLSKPKPKPAPEPEVETLDLEPDAEVVPTPIDAAPIAAAASPTAAAATTTPIDDDPEVASSSFLDAPKPTRRRPTAPPPTINDLITNAPSSSLNELPRGAFVYPMKRPSRLPLVIGLLLLSAAIGGGAMWFLNRDKGEPKTPPVAAVEIDAAAPAVEIDAAMVAAVEPDAAEVEPDIEMTPPDAAEVAATDPKPIKPTTTKPTTTRPTTTKPVEKPAQTEKPVVEDKPAGPVAEPGCEEVACVLEKYARPCCLRFKPQGGSFVPSSASGDDLSKPQIKAGVDKLKPRVIACGEQHAAKGKGTVKLSISVNGEGNVTELSVQTSPDDALGECVASALRKAKFATTKNGGSFTYPFVF